MTEYRAATISYNLDKLREYCLKNDGDAVRVQLIDYIREIVKALPTTK